MANEDGNKGLPIPYLTAVWSGMTADELQAGLAAGSILPPLGSPPLGSPPLRPSAVAAFAEGIDARTAARERAAAAEGASGIAAASRAQIDAWLRALDPEFTDTALDALWQRAGRDDAARGTTLRRYLGETLLGDSVASTASIDAFVASPGHRARIVDLHGMTGNELAALAATDIGYRHALVTMQPLALTGNRALYAQANADGGLDRFDPDTGEALVSDAWLADRAKLLAWRSADANTRAIVGNEDWTFVDRTSLGTDGKPLTVELVTGKTDAGKNQVVFGNAGDELLQGVSGSDRMYGGDGDDILRGAAGGDHLEGGRGDDLVLGGAGNDELVGDQGADELDGGRGDDRLTGGSGDDLLVGGRGDDRLEGGSGHDTYVIDGGDGHDTIVDVDGKGSIELDGKQIAGEMDASDHGTWTSADGRLEFSVAGESTASGTLTIKAFGEGAERSDTPINVVTVKDWKNGDLGITLGGTPTAGTVSGPTYDPMSITGPEVPILSHEDLVGDAEAEGAEDANGAAAEGAVNTDIAWGDVAPVSDGSATSDSGTTPGDTADGADADFMSALAAIFDTEPADFAAVEPAHLESALGSFAGVLEAPDITSSASFVATHDANAVTAQDYADALAGDFAGDDIGSESGLLLQMPVVPDLRRSDVVSPSASFLRAGQTVS